MSHQRVLKKPNPHRMRATSHLQVTTDQQIGSGRKAAAVSFFNGDPVIKKRREEDDTLVTFHKDIHFHLYL